MKKKGQIIEVYWAKRAKKLLYRYDSGKLFQIGDGKAFKIDGTINNPASFCT